MKKWKEDIVLIARSLGVIHKVSAGLLAVVLFKSVFTAFAPFITMYMSSRIINGIAAKMELERLLILVAITITAGLAVHLLGSFFGHYVNYLQHRFWTKGEMVLSGKMMELDYMDVESPRIHQLRQRMKDFENTGGEGIWNVLGQFREMVENAFTVIFSFSFVLSLFTARFQGEASGFLGFIVSPAAALILVAAIVANAFAGMRFGRRMMEKSHTLMQGAAGANRIYGYYLENHIMTYHTGKDVRIYNQKGLLQEEAKQMYDVGAAMVDGQVRNEAKYSGAVALFTVALSTLVYLFVGFRALAGMIGVGELVLYIGSISRFTEGFSGFVMALTGLRTNNDAMKVYFEFLDTPTRMAESMGGESAICGSYGDRSLKSIGHKAAVAGKLVEHKVAVTEKSKRHKAATAEKSKGYKASAVGSSIEHKVAADEKSIGSEMTAVGKSIEYKVAVRGKSTGRKMTVPEKSMEHEVEFRDVSFRYPDTETWALRHISMKFRSGKSLAVVGMNGSGKTTLIKLLCRLYDPTEGCILLDGVDIRNISQEEYRELFSVVFQDYKLFSFPLSQNVAAQMEAEPGRVEECLKRAGFGERLSAMASCIDTCLYRDFEEAGVEVSGGEAQKIALARALYKDAPIIVLDEPTAALDPAAEYEIYTRFNEIIGDKAAIYISHRLSSCRFCDDIAVFHEGELVQRGRHDELVAIKGGKYFELWNAQAQHYVDG